MTIDLKMALRNIWRNPRRTILTITAISFASILLVFMLSFQFGSYETMINSSVKISTGHLQIQRDGYYEKRGMRQTVNNPEKLQELLKTIDIIDGFTFRAEAFSLISSESRTEGVLITGISPELEAGVSNIKSFIRDGKYLVEKDNNLALVGKLLAKNLKVEIGDELTILGQGKDGSVAATVVTVKGIFSSGMDAVDRSSVYIPLKHFQETFTMEGSVHMVVITGKSLGDIGNVKEQIQSGLSEQFGKGKAVVLDWQELMPGLMQGIKLDLISGAIFYLILIIVVAFSILNTFLMAIFERTREFGVMMSIGTTPSRLTRIVLFESVGMTSIGIIIGIVAGCIITKFFEVKGIDISGSSELLRQFGISGIIYPKLSLLSALTGPLIVFFITFLSSLFPALKIQKMKPVEALSHT